MHVHVLLSGASPLRARAEELESQISPPLPEEAVARIRDLETTVSTLSKKNTELEGRFDRLNSFIRRWLRDRMSEAEILEMEEDEQSV